MAERKRSLRTQRRLRLQVARRVTVTGPPKRQRQDSDSTVGRGPASESTASSSNFVLETAGRDAIDGNESASDFERNSDYGELYRERPYLETETVFQQAESQSDCETRGDAELQFGASGMESEDSSLGCASDVSLPESEDEASSAFRQAESTDSESHGDTERLQFPVTGCEEFEDSSLDSCGSEVSFSEHGDDVSPLQAPSCSGGQLYLDSQIGVHEFHVAFMSLCQRHNLTYASQSDILKLMSMVIPTPNKVLSSAHSLKNKFVRYEAETIVRRFCGHCMEPLQGSHCAKPECTRVMAPCATFVQLPLDLQLKGRLEGMPLFLSCGAGW